MKICEIFCGKSLKEDLSIDTTFDPCNFPWDSPFKSVKERWGGWGVSHLEEPAPVLGEDVEPVEVEGVLADGGALGDGRSSLLHETEPPPHSDYSLHQCSGSGWIRIRYTDPAREMEVLQVHFLCKIYHDFHLFFTILQ